ETTQGTGSGNDVPSWVKNNAGWWADGTIDDDAFIQGIQFLIKEGILKVE
ncbi:MAG: peptidase, partial [Nitrosopumilus sp.]